MKLEIPIYIPSMANARLHWSARSREVKRQRDITAVMFRANVRTKPCPPCTITLTRRGPRKMDDDNLISSFKAVRDQLAKEMGVDDGSSDIQWKYGFEKSKDYSILIDIEEVHKNWKDGKAR